MKKYAAAASTVLWASPAILLLARSVRAERHRAPKTDAAKIANALSAAPANVSRNASVVEMNSDGSKRVLRKGSSAWTCHQRVQPLHRVRIEAHRVVSRCARVVGDAYDRTGNGVDTAIPYVMWKNTPMNI
jgi:hypothetical protein